MAGKNANVKNWVPPRGLKNFHHQPNGFTFDFFLDEIKALVEHVCDRIVVKRFGPHIAHRDGNSCLPNNVHLRPEANLQLAEQVAEEILVAVENASTL